MRYRLAMARFRLRMVARRLRHNLDAVPVGVGLVAVGLLIKFGSWAAFLLVGVYVVAWGLADDPPPAGDDEA